MKKSIIVAQSENHVIGVNNTLPWHLPADLKHFKELTMGHHIIMGRKTYESIGKPLPGRTSIIISRNKEYKVEGCITVSSIQEAYNYAQQNGESEAFVIGGADIIKQAISQSEYLYLTIIHIDFEGDTFLDELSTSWKLQNKKTFEPDEKNKYTYSFIEYKNTSLK
jgi:dihydrofolate reductase